MFKIIAIALIGLIITGCSNPMNTKITKENYEEVMEKARKKASEEDWKKVEAIRSLAKFAAFTGKSEEEFFDGKSISETLETVKKNLEAKAESDKAEELKRLKAAKDESEHSEKLMENFEILSWTKGNSTDEYHINKKVRLSLKMKNKSDHDIDAFEGKIGIFDKLGNQLASLGIKSTDLLKAGSNKDLIWEFSTIDFHNKMDEVYASQGGELKFKFEPSKVLLKDGTVL